MIHRFVNGSLELLRADVPAFVCELVERALEAFSRLPGVLLPKELDGD
jgi:hypothetical protein